MIKKIVLLTSLICPACALFTARGPVSLQPKFSVGEARPLRVVASETWSGPLASERQSYDMTMRMRIAELFDGAPLTVEFTEVNGPQVLSSIVGGVETETERRENRDGTITARVDANTLIHDARDLGHLSDDILLIFPPGPCFGFVPPPAGKARMGDAWPSGDIVPAGPRTIKKGQIKFSGARGEFKLEEIRESAAAISWNGSADVSFDNRGFRREGKAEWSRHIVYDLKKRMFRENSGIMTITLPEGMEIVMNVSIKMGK